MENSSRSGVIYTKDPTGKRGTGMENPFTFKVGQVFTGFGIGCGLGIGIGRPLNLGAIPVLNQVMTATRGASDAFSGVQRHVNNSLRKVGAKNIEAGIGCGVGFGHGFGVGLALKPGVIHQIQTHVFKAVTVVIAKFGMCPTLSVDKGILPASLQNGLSMIEKSSDVNAGESTSQLVKSVSNSTYEGNVADQESLISSTKYSSRTEAVLDNFLKSPLLKEETTLREQAGPQQLDNSLLQMVLKHQLLIEELMQENEKLRQILVEELKVQPRKFQTSFSSSRSKSLCDECFECRRKQRRSFEKVGSSSESNTSRQF